MREFSLGVRLHLARLGAREQLLARLVEVGTRLTGVVDALYIGGTATAAALELDAFVALGALTVRAGGPCFGELPSALDHHPPALLAKLVSSLDAMSVGGAVAVLGPPNHARVTPDELGALREALEVLRAMLRVPAPSLSGERYRISNAWNEPRAAHGAPVALGLYVPRAAFVLAPDAQLPVAQELFALAARFAEQCFVELDDTLEAREPLAALAAHARAAGRLASDIRLVGVYDSVAADDVHARVRTLRELGYAGAVLDWTGADLEALIDELARVRELVEVEP